MLKMMTLTLMMMMITVMMMLTIIIIAIIISRPSLFSKPNRIALQENEVLEYRIFFQPYLFREKCLSVFVQD